MDARRSPRAAAAQGALTAAGPARRWRAPVASITDRARRLGRSSPMTDARLRRLEDGAVQMSPARAAGDRILGYPLIRSRCRGRAAFTAVHAIHRRADAQVRPPRRSARTPASCPVPSPRSPDPSTLAASALAQACRPLPRGLARARAAMARCPDWSKRRRPPHRSARGSSSRAGPGASSGVSSPGRRGARARVPAALRSGARRRLHRDRHRPLDSRASPGGWLFVGAVTGLQVLLATTGVCVGCRLYILRLWAPAQFARVVGRSEVLVRVSLRRPIGGPERDR